MSMDHLYKEIQKFQFKVKDVTDDPSHHIGKALKQEVQKLEDEAQVRKNPRSLEDRVKRIIRLLEEAGEHEVISHPDVHMLVEQCEDFRKDLQKMS